MVKYADGPKIEVELAIDAPASQVWEIVSDPSLPARFSEELIEAHWDSHPSGNPSVGSIIVGKNFNESIGEWITKSFVTAWIPGQTFAWAVREIEDSASRWRFELESKSGQTILRQHYFIGPGTTAITRWIEADPENEEEILEGRLAFQAKNMMNTLEGVKALCES